MLHQNEGRARVPGDAPGARASVHKWLHATYFTAVHTLRCVTGRGQK